MYRYVFAVGLPVTLTQILSTTISKPNLFAPISYHSVRLRPPPRGHGPTIRVRVGSRSTGRARARARVRAADRVRNWVRQGYT